MPIKVGPVSTCEGHGAQVHGVIRGKIVMDRIRPPVVGFVETAGIASLEIVSYVGRRAVARGFTAVDEEGACIETTHGESSRDALAGEVTEQARELSLVIGNEQSRIRLIGEVQAGDAGGGSRSRSKRERLR